MGVQTLVLKRVSLQRAQLKTGFNVKKVNEENQAGRKPVLGTALKFTRNMAKCLGVCLAKDGGIGVVTQSDHGTRRILRLVCVIVATAENCCRFSRRELSG